MSSAPDLRSLDSATVTAASSAAPPPCPAPDANPSSLPHPPATEHILESMEEITRLLDASLEQAVAQNPETTAADASLLLTTVDELSRQVVKGQSDQIHLLTDLKVSLASIEVKLREDVDFMKKERRRDLLMKLIPTEVPINSVVASLVQHVGGRSALEIIVKSFIENKGVYMAHYGPLHSYEKEFSDKVFLITGGNVDYFEAKNGRACRFVL
jgi:hypothetical protein